MRLFDTRFVALFLAAGVLVASTAGNVSAAIITNGTVSVGIAPNGELDDGTVGMRRISDGYDPIRPGTPRDSWGVSAGATAGWANHSFYGVSSIVANGAPIFGLSTASISSFLNAGGPNLLQIDQAYSFVASNVLAIATTISNVSGAATSVKFSRNVDWDIAPTLFSETITVDPLSGAVSNASYTGFENPNPLIPYAFSSGAGGGVFGPGDLGAAYQLSLGSLGAGASASFTSYYALSSIGQSEASLRAQLAALGATFIATGRDSGSAAGTNFAAIGVGPVVPEPSSLVLLSLGAVSLIGAARRRKQAETI